MTGVQDWGHPEGLPPDELDSSLAVLELMAAEVGATTALLHTPPGTNGGRCAVVRVETGCKDDVSYTDLRIAGETMHAGC